MMRGYVLLVLLVFGIGHLIECCNEAICASIVSKCMLTGSCKCDVKNQTCSKDCFLCLDDLYTECCSCVEMCTKPNKTVSALSRQSSVEDLPDPTPALFAALTSEEDILGRWYAFTFPVDIPLASAKENKHIKLITVNSEQETIEVKDLVTVNCTVAYMGHCMPSHKCRGSCISMGASSYRWFHDSCCQCVGQYCINYGINESRCKGCPYDDEEEDDDEILDYEDYEEIDDSYNEVEFTHEYTTKKKKKKKQNV